MRTFAREHEEIERYRNGGRAGGRVRGRYHEVAAKYMMQLPAASRWEVNDELILEDKLANYLKNAIAVGKRYASQEMTESGSSGARIESGYEWWDDEVVRQYFKTSYVCSTEGRTSSMDMEQQTVAEPSPSADSESQFVVEVDTADIPVISGIDNTTASVPAGEVAAVAGQTMRRVTSLGGAVNSFRDALIPVIQSLHSRLASDIDPVAAIERRRAVAITWVMTKFTGTDRMRAMLMVVEQSQNGEELADGIARLADNGVANSTIAEFVTAYLGKSAPPQEYPQDWMDIHPND